MFSKLFSQSDRIEVITDFDRNHFLGKFIGADSTFLYLSDFEDCLQAIALPHVMRCRKLTVDSVSDLDAELNRIEARQTIGSHNEEAVAEGIKSQEEEEKCVDAAALPQEESISGEEKEAVEETRRRIGDFLPERKLFVNTPILDGPKVVGTIDLPTDRRKKPKTATDEGSDFKKGFRASNKTEGYVRKDDPEYKKEWQKENDIWHLYPQAMGVVKSVRFKFGFITTPDGEDLCFQGYNKADKLMPGDKVLFTPYEYPGKGTQARSVVRVRSVGAMLKKLARMDEFEEKVKIDDILDQLRAAFPDNEMVQNAIDNRLSSMEEDVDMTPSKEHRPKKASANEFKLDLKRIASRLLPDNYVSYRIQMAEMIENKKNSDDTFERNLVYDIYTSLIKNSFGRDERVRFIDEAVEYYRDMGQDVKADYFERLKTVSHERYGNHTEKQDEDSVEVRDDDSDDVAPLHEPEVKIEEDGQETAADAPVMVSEVDTEAVDISEDTVETEDKSDEETRETEEKEETEETEENVENTVNETVTSVGKVSAETKEELPEPEN